MTDMKDDEVEEEEDGRRVMACNGDTGSGGAVVAAAVVRTLVVVGVGRKRLREGPTAAPLSSSVVERGGLLVLPLRLAGLLGRGGRATTIAVPMDTGKGKDEEVVLVERVEWLVGKGEEGESGVESGREAVMEGTGKKSDPVAGSSKVMALEEVVCRVGLPRLSTRPPPTALERRMTSPSDGPAMHSGGSTPR